MLFAIGSGTLIAEQYVASHPLAGLVLLGRPLQQLQAAAPRSNYEPFFPVALMGQTTQDVNQRLQQDYPDYVDVLQSGPTAKLLDEETWKQVSSWVEENSWSVSVLRNGETLETDALIATQT